MSETFDPYQQWLGIDPQDRPVDYYRLLGVARFERDPEVIGRAADERMTHVRRFQTGPRGQHTQQLLNELASARRCLLDPQAKAAYDAVLEGVQAAAAGAVAESVEPSPLLPAPAAPPLEPPLPPQQVVPQQAVPYDYEPAPPPLSVPSRPVEVSARRNRQATSPEGFGGTDDQPFSSQLWFPAAIVVGIAVVIGLVWGLGRQRTGPADEPAASAPGPDSGQQPTPREQPQEEPEPVVIAQEGSGEINFSPTVAELQGENVQRHMRDGQDVIGNWTGTEDHARWHFRVVQPGFFRVQVTYSVPEQGVPRRYVLAVDDEERVLELRRSSGGPDSFVTDEHFVAVRRRGQHTLTVRPESESDQELMVLRSIRFVPQTRGM